MRIGSILRQIIVHVKAGLFNFALRYVTSTKIHTFLYPPVWSRSTVLVMHNRKYRARMIHPVLKCMRCGGCTPLSITKLCQN